MGPRATQEGRGRVLTDLSTPGASTILAAWKVWSRESWPGKTWTKLSLKTNFKNQKRRHQAGNLAYPRRTIESCLPDASCEGSGAELAEAPELSHGERRDLRPRTSAHLPSFRPHGCKHEVSGSTLPEQTHRPGRRNQPQGHADAPQPFPSWLSVTR